MDQTADCIEKAEASWSGRGGSIRLPEGCYRVVELEAIESGGKVTLRLLGKDWASYFESREPCCLPPRVQPPLEEREGWD